MTLTPSTTTGAGTWQVRCDRGAATPTTQDRDDAEQLAVHLDADRAWNIERGEPDRCGRQHEVIHLSG